MSLPLINIFLNAVVAVVSVVLTHRVTMKRARADVSLVMSDTSIALSKYVDERFVNLGDSLRERIDELELEKDILKENLDASLQCIEEERKKCEADIRRLSNEISLLKSQKNLADAEADKYKKVAIILMKKLEELGVESSDIFIIDVFKDEDDIKRNRTPNHGEQQE